MVRFLAIALAFVLGGPQLRTPMPPLPVCGSCASPYGYDQTLPWTPPAPYTNRDFIRADAWGVEVHGLPRVPGGSTEHPERLLTAFLYKYPRDTWDHITDTYLSRGYTHWILWWPNARADGWSIDRFVAMCTYLQSRHLYVQVGLVSKDFDPRNQTAEQWKARLDPVFDALGAAHAADEYAVWEWDAFNVPGESTIRALQYMGRRAHAQGASFWIHFFPGRTSFVVDGDPRGQSGFYDDLGTDVDGLQYQADPAWDIGELQSHLADVLKQFAEQGNRQKLRAFELQALREFTNDHPDEAEESILGYLALCTQSPGAVVWGYGNGGVYPDGRPL